MHKASDQKYWKSIENLTENKFNPNSFSLKILWYVHTRPLTSSENKCRRTYPNKEFETTLLRVPALPLFISPLHTCANCKYLLTPCCQNYLKATCVFLCLYREQQQQHIYMHFHSKWPKKQGEVCVLVPTAFGCIRITAKVNNYEIIWNGCDRWMDRQLMFKIFFKRNAKRILLYLGLSWVVKNKLFRRSSLKSQSKKYFPTQWKCNYILCDMYVYNKNIAGLRNYAKIKQIKINSCAVWAATYPIACTHVELLLWQAINNSRIRMIFSAVVILWKTGKEL